MSNITNISIYEQQGDMHLSCAFHDTNNRNETEQLFKQLIDSSIESSSWTQLHEKFSARLIKKGDETLMEFKEINNPEGFYGRPMVLNIIPAFLLSADIIDKSNYDFAIDTISRSDVVKKRINAINENQKEVLAARTKIMDSFNKK